MRLSQTDLSIMKEAFRELFHINDHLWLFGSRIDDKALGGDIDLFIETNLDGKNAVDAKIKFSTALKKKLGDQKIDIVLQLLGDSYEAPIYEIAKQKGIQII